MNQCDHPAGKSACHHSVIIASDMPQVLLIGNQAFIVNPYFPPVVRRVAVFPKGAKRYTTGQYLHLYCQVHQYG